MLIFSVADIFSDISILIYSLLSDERSGFRVVEGWVFKNSFRGITEFRVGHLIVVIPIVIIHVDTALVINVIPVAVAIDVVLLVMALVSELINFRKI